MKSHDVAVCRCGVDPAMLKTPSGHFVIRCENTACAKRVSLSRPRANQAVKAWNHTQGVTYTTAGKPKVAARGNGDAGAVAPVTVEPIELTRRDRWRMRIRRFGLRILWAVARPGWQACDWGCGGPFTVGPRETYDCSSCGLPYAKAEIETMLRESRPDLKAVEQ